MIITLNEDVAPFFFLPVVGIHLSYENPGPVEVDQTKLSPSELKQVQNAVMNKSIIAKGFNPITSQEVKPKAQITAIDLETKRILVIENAKKSLSAPLPTLLKAIEKNPDITHLKAMHEWEIEHKNRDKVVDALKNRIDAISKALSLSIGPGLNESNVQKEAKMPEIEYTEEETITINLGDKE